MRTDLCVRISIAVIAVGFAACPGGPKPQPQPEPTAACKAQWNQYDSDVAAERVDHPGTYYIEPDSTEVLIRFQFQDPRCSSVGSPPCVDYTGEAPVRTNLIVYNRPAGQAETNVFVSYESSPFNHPDTTAETDALNATQVPYGTSTVGVRHQTQGNAARHYFFRVAGPVFQPQGGWSQLYRALGLGNGFHEIPGLTATLYRSARHKPPCPR